MTQRDSVSVGQRVRQERLARHWSQERLAEALGTTAMTIRRWEHQEVFPQTRFREPLCRLFDWPSEAFFGPVAFEQSEASPLWMLPFPRNPFFTGREGLLAAVHARLTPEQPTAHPRALALSGLAGIGKTQVALEYAYRALSSYQAIFWLAADTTESMMSSMQVIANHLSLPEGMVREQARMVAAVQQWLSTHTDWLLIADNVEDLDLLQTMLPPMRPGALLLTTHHQALGMLAEPLGVPPMSREEGRLLLLRRARRLSLATPESAPPQEEWPGIPSTTPIGAVVNLLEGLPLALDQAGAYLEEVGCSIGDYMRRYRDQRKHVLARRGMHGGAHPASVATTLKLAAERVKRTSPAAVELLRLCSFLHVEGIPEEVFVAGTFVLGPVLGPSLADPYQFDLILATLRNASLVKRSPETQTLSIHRLVQAVLQDQMELAEKLVWGERALLMLNAAFPNGAIGTWDSCERYLAHVLACISFLEQSTFALPQAGDLLLKAASYLIERGRYGEAKPLLEQAVALEEQRPEPDYQVLLSRHLKHIELLWRLGTFEAVEEQLQQMLTLGVQHLEADHPQVADVLDFLGFLYWFQGKYDRAEPLTLRALHIREQRLGPEHPRTAWTCQSLANLYRDQGQYERAEPWYQQALRIQEQQLGSTHPQVALTLDALGTLHREQGRYEQAERLYQRALQLLEQQLGADHPDTAIARYDLATLFREQGQYEQAEALYQQIVQGLEPVHALVGQALSALGTLHRDREQYEQAESCYQQAWSLQERGLSPESPQTAQTLRGLARLFHLQGQYERAEPLYQRALAISQRCLGKEHPQVYQLQREMAVLVRAKEPID